MSEIGFLTVETLTVGNMRGKVAVRTATGSGFGPEEVATLVWLPRKPLAIPHTQAEMEKPKQIEPWTSLPQVTETNIFSCEELQPGLPALPDTPSLPLNSSWPLSWAKNTEWKQESLQRCGWKESKLILPIPLLYRLGNRGKDLLLAEVPRVLVW